MKGYPADEQLSTWALLRWAFHALIKADSARLDERNRLIVSAFDSTLDYLNVFNVVDFLGLMYFSREEAAAMEPAVSLMKQLVATVRPFEPYLVANDPRWPQLVETAEIAIQAMNRNGFATRFALS